MLARGAFETVAQGLLSDGIAVRFRAGGSSMKPTIADGECLVVAPADAKSIDVADVVLCRTPRGLAAHRVLRVETRADGARRFTTCGDAALETDRPVDAADVQGRVVSVERDGGPIDLAVWGGVLGRLTVLAALELARAVRRLRARDWIAAAVSARNSA